MGAIMAMSIRAGTAKIGIVIGAAFLLVAVGAPVAAQQPVPASQRVMACDPRIALAAAEELVKLPDALKAPLRLFDAAGVLFDQGRKDEAVFWFLMGHLQLWYSHHVPSAGQMLANMAGPKASRIANYALQDTRRFEQALARVQQLDREMSNPTPDRREQIYLQVDDLRATIALEREVIEREARAVAAEIASRPRRTCLQVLVHPADASRLIAAERAQVVEFAKKQPDVITAVGAVKRAAVGNFTVLQDHVLPSQYEVAVTGDKAMFAIVDVSRDASGAQFKLVCVARTSFWNRDISKSPCEQ